MEGRSTKRYGSVSYTGFYLHRISAVLVSIALLVEGAMMFAIEYPLFQNFVLFAGSPAQQAKVLGQDLTAIIESFDANELLQPAQMLTGLTLASCILIVLVMMADLLMTLLGAGAAIALCAAGRGARMMRAIHLIRMWAYVLLGVFGIGSFIVNMVNVSGLQMAGGLLQGQDASVIRVVLAVIAALALIALLMQIFYHKDIADAMSTVCYETETGISDGAFRRTHLSGLSFLIGIPWILLLVSLAAAAFKEPAQLLKNPYLILTMVLVLARAVKQYSLCFCYRNLKYARVATQDNYSGGA